MELFPVQLYYPVYLHVVLIWCIFVWARYSRMNLDRLLYQRKPYAAMAIFATLFIVVVGLRPVSGRIFGDTSNYAYIYRNMQWQGAEVILGDGEWLFNGLMYLCSQVMDVQGFFLIVEFCYVGLMFWAVKRLVPNNVTAAMLFCFSAFSFFSYGTNGIRNGLACSIVLLALSFVNKAWRGKIVALILCFIAYNIHHATALPILCMVVSILFRNTKAVYAFWFISIAVSLVAGNSVANVFAGLGFDDRLAGYITAQADEGTFSHTGFRWDFLLYSAMPLWLGWYIVIKRGIRDKSYLLLLHTYILCNAFWIMVIRASYSNRFAYLSWFMYPFVLAYPLLKLPVWKDQGSKVGLILMLHVSFTYFMWLIG